MKLFRVLDLPGRWIGEDQDGALVHWPAEPGGWQRRTPYQGDRTALEEVAPAAARGSGWPGGGRGPRPRAGGEASTARVAIRATPAEVAAWTELAEHAGQPLTAWARDELNAALERARAKK